MGSQLKIGTRMRLAVGICLTAVLLLVADANPGAKPLTVKAQVGVDVNSGESQSSGGKDNPCVRQNGQCLKYGEAGCALDCSQPCCEGLLCGGSVFTGACCAIGEPLCSQR